MYPMPFCAEEESIISIANSLRFLSFHHALQLLTQCISDPPLPRPFLTQFLHPTAR